MNALTPEEAEAIQRLIDLGWTLGTDAWLEQDNGSAAFCPVAIGKAGNDEQHLG